MLKIGETAQDRFAEILEAASQAPPEVSHTFLRSLAFLSRYGDKDNVATLHVDFAPLSMTFTIMTKEGEYVINGGLIYQGPEQPADGSAPSFTVSLNNGTGWFIHT